jgi:uncharacterized protein
VNTITETLSKELLEILACPTCKGDLVLKKDSLICEGCKVTYEIKEGIPILLPKK